jgi:nucleotide-binding universal stress UspA family protein
MAPTAEIMLASPGAPFAPEVVDGVLEVAGERRPAVLVLSVARIWGTALGMPHPGLHPTRRELDEQREIVSGAALRLAERGFEVAMRVVSARDAGRAIARWAERSGCGVIVIADPPCGRWQRLLRGDPPRDLLRRTRIPLHTVVVR